MIITVIRMRIIRTAPLEGNKNLPSLSLMAQEKKTQKRRKRKLKNQHRKRRKRRTVKERKKREMNKIVIARSWLACWL